MIGSPGERLVASLQRASLGMSFEWLLAARGGEMPGHMSPAACITLLLLASATPLERDRRVLGLSMNALVAAVVGATGFFVLLGLSLRVLRFDIAAPLL